MVTSQTNIIQDYLDKSIKCNDQLIYILVGYGQNPKWKYRRQLLIAFRLYMHAIFSTHVYKCII